MQELIEYIELNQPKNKITDGIWSKAVSLLEKEKRVITGAYNQSTYQFANNAEVINPLSAKDYYNEKFNNNDN
jgi:hypothetical protein